MKRQQFQELKMITNYFEQLFVALLFSPLFLSLVKSKTRKTFFLNVNF